MLFTPTSISRSTTSSTQTSESFDDSKRSSLSGKYEICRERGADTSPHRRYAYSRTFSRGKDEYGGGADEETKGYKFDSEPSKSTKEDYDFDHFLVPARSANIKGGILELLRGCLGVGMLAMHASYKECGLWTALLLNIVVGIFMTYSMHELARSARKLYISKEVPALAYIDFIEATCEFCPWSCIKNNSRRVRHVVETVTCLYFFSVCAVCQLMLARAIRQIVNGKYSSLTDDEYFTSERIYVAALLLPFSLLVIFITINNLAPFSIVWNFYIGLITFTCINSAISTGVESPLDAPAFKSVTGIFELIGVTLFAIDGCGATLHVENSIKRPEDFPLVLIGGMPIVILIAIIIGFFGYCAFGEKSTAPITLNYSWRSSSYTIKFLSCVMMYVTFGTNFWQPSNIVWRYISHYYDEERHWIWEKVFRMLMMVLTTVLAVAIPDTTKFMALMGTFCVGFLAFLIPNCISLVTDWKDPGPGRYYWRVWKTVFMVLLSLFIIFMGSAINGIGLVRDLVYRTRGRSD